MRIKKAIAMFICVSLVMLAALPSVAKGEEIGISPFFSYTNSVRTTLTISSSGKATASGILTGIIGTTTKVSITLYLEKYQSGKWTAVTNWSQTFNSFSGTLQKTASVSKGYTYRVRGVYKSYKGTASESINSNSSEIKY